MSVGKHQSPIEYHNRKRCAVCPREQETFVCINCGCSYYCSRQCKKLDEPVHSALCKPFEKFEDRSCQSVRRAIYFPVDSPLPKFVWLQMDQRYDYRHPDLDDMRKNFLGDPEASEDYLWPIEVDKDYVYMTSINPSIMLGWGSNKSSTDQPLNKAITMLVCNESHGVRGPIITYGQIRTAHGPLAKSAVVTDLDTTDLAVIVNYFLGRHRESDTPIKSVRIFSNGEQSRSGYHFEPGFLLSSSMFCEGDAGITSQISVLFSLPLVLVSPLLRGLEYTNSVLCDHIDELRSLMPPDKANRTAARLLIDIGYHDKSSASEFGTIPEQYLGQNLGNVTVARKDMKPLRPEYLQAFCDWIEEDLLHKFTDTNGEIRYALANEIDDEKRATKLAKLKQKMWDRCSRASFYAWCKKEGLRLDHF